MSCRKESDMTEWLINKLAVQWLRLQASTAGLYPWWGNLRSGMPQDTEGGKKTSYELVLTYISYKLLLISIWIPVF